ncbi:MAG: hypothetical protein R3174_08565 [Gammaproteobacteria bacterium]|nr:hypothetical protein [Gammaproteobacteria bacterium]
MTLHRWMPAGTARHFIVVLVVLTCGALTAGLGGCAQIEKNKRAKGLDTAVKLYASAIRWGNFETALALTRPREGEPAIPDNALLGSLRVTAYSSRILSVDEEAGEARVTTHFDYYLQDSGSVRSVSQTANWYYDAAAESWFLDGGLPEFRR